MFGSATRFVDFDLLDIEIVHPPRSIDTVLYLEAVAIRLDVSLVKWDFASLEFPGRRHPEELENVVVNRWYKPEAHLGRDGRTELTWSGLKALLAVGGNGLHIYLYLNPLPSARNTSPKDAADTVACLLLSADGYWNGIGPRRSMRSVGRICMRGFEDWMQDDTASGP